MHSTEAVHVDLLVDGEDEGLLRVALNAGDFVLQWHAVPRGGLRAMREVLTRDAGEERALYVGQILRGRLYLVRREGIFSFKSSALDSSSDLFRFDLPTGSRERLIVALDDAIEDWEA